jgi:hypothetical protein
MNNETLDVRPSHVLLGAKRQAQIRPIRKETNIKFQVYQLRDFENEFDSFIFFQI